MMPLYSVKDNLIYKLHPFTLVFFIFSIFMLSLMFTHPIYLGALLIIISFTIIDSGNYKEWKGYLKFSIPIILIIIIVNGLFVKAGSNVLYSGPRLPIIGKIRITMEAVTYGVAMGVRLLIIISIFCLYTYTVKPDKFMKLFSKFSSKIVFVVILSVRLFPLMVEDYRRIMEVQKTRGVRIDTGKWIDKIRNTYPVITALLLSSLERSFQQAESMYARGYGSGKRTIYNKDLWRLRDYIIIAVTIFGLIIGIAVFIKGDATYSYYPKLTSLEISNYIFLFLLIISFMMPVILDWGWKKWPLLKSKI